MSPDTTHTAHCLCGAVTLHVTPLGHSVGACHCGMCRRWSGGPMLAVECASEMHIEGEDRVGRFRSSDWAERGFCTACGSGLFYRVLGTGKYYVPAGIFERQEVWVLDHQIFIDRKPGWYAFANPTEDLTEAEVVARFASGQF
jgi:hypothetical protein